MRKGSDADNGQVSVSVVATLPFAVLAVVVAVQLGLVGHAAFAAATSARAAARAAHVGADPEELGLASLPESLRERAAIESTADGVEVTIDVPRLIPGLPRLPLTIGASLGPEGVDE